MRPSSRPLRWCARARLVSDGPAIYATMPQWKPAVFSEPRFPRNMPGVWDAHFGFVTEETGQPVVVGETGGTAEGDDRVWVEAAVSYFKSRGFSIFWYCLNPNSDDTGGLLLDDWRTPNRPKLDLLAPLPATRISRLHSLTPSLGATASPTTAVQLPAPPLAPSPPPPPPSPTDAPSLATQPIRADEPRLTSGRPSPRPPLPPPPLTRSTSPPPAGLRVGIANQGQTAVASTPPTPEVATGNEPQLLQADGKAIEDASVRMAGQSRSYQSDEPSDRSMRTTTRSQPGAIAGDDAEAETTGEDDDASGVIFGFSFGVVLTGVGTPPDGPSPSLSVPSEH